MSSNVIYCQNCGTQNTAGGNFCVSCGNRLSVYQPGDSPERPAQQPEYGNNPYVSNHLVWAILATIFCCLPAGIVSIVYAAQVNGKLASGDFQGAVSYSNSAKTWAWVSFGIGLFFGGGWILLSIIGAAATA